MIFVNISEIYYFYSLFHFDHNIIRQLLWARGLAVSKNTVSATVPVDLPKQHLLYHPALCPNHKMIALVIVMPL